MSTTARSSAQQAEERILRAAAELFAASDFASVTVPEVAARARVGLQTLYQHFPSKEALGNAVFRRCKQTWAAATLDRLPLDAGPAEQFEAYWSHLCEYARDNRDAALYNERNPIGHAFDEESRKLRAELDERSAGILNAWVTSRQVKNLPQEVLKALIHGTFHRILELPVPSQVREELLQVTGVAIWDSLAARSPRRAGSSGRSKTLRKAPDARRRAHKAGAVT